MSTAGLDPSERMRAGARKRGAAGLGPGLRTSLTIGIILTMVCSSNNGNSIWHIFVGPYPRRAGRRAGRRAATFYGVSEFCRAVSVFQSCAPHTWQV
eukprot:997930-Prymnesium_polylepis.1